MIEKAGHTVACVVSDEADARAQLDSELDCFVAAGGDGTIARAGRMLTGGRLPLAILPVGTANNIARSLGIDGDAGTLIERWSLDRIGHVDVGVVEHGGARSYFLESVGCGLVTECIDEGRFSIPKDHPETHLADARDLYIEKLQRFATRRYQIELDDETIDGEFLVVEALNTPSIGPRLELSSAASAGDGWLTLVAVSDRDRARLAQYLTALRNGAEREAALESWRVRAIVIRGADRIHIDDKVVAVESDRVAIGILPSALPVLT